MSIAKCISYCLEDRISLSEEQKIALSAAEGLQHKNRAEILEYNHCFGDKKELINQFLDVRKLKPGVEKPVIHITLRPSPGDVVNKAKFIEMGQAAAKEFGLEKNQYICILHSDTPEPHIHIVGNRIGFDGKLASDRHSYRRAAELSRRLELKHDLKQVQSPRRFQTPEQRQQPRHDLRKEILKQDIQIALKGCTNFSDFTRKMEEKKYQVIKGRGIAFQDEKKVWTKGSEVGFSLRTIEVVLEANQLKHTWDSGNLTPEQKEKFVANWGKFSDQMENQLRRDKWIGKDRGPALHETYTVNGMLHILLRPELEGQSLPWQLRQDKRKKHKRKHSLRL
jgi:Relaxase/Mobilisation nuclease domain